MKRVVITGIGIWSCIGKNIGEVTESLRLGKSGIISDPSRNKYGIKSSLVGNVPKPDLKALLPRKIRVNMSEDSEYAYMAAREAFNHAGISDNYLLNNEVGVIFGNDGNALSLVESHEIMQQYKDTLMVGPYALFKGETSSASMNLSSIFHLRGISLCVSAACASGSHAIGIGTSLIRDGIQNIILVGGSAEVNRYIAYGIDALGALSLRNATPTSASRPFDRDRDGMVLSGGAAALVLEEYEHAIARDANILAEVAGYGFSSNGIDNISQPDSNAELLSMKRALNNARISANEVDYINAHATSTIVGDKEELIALQELFGGTKAWISSTKSITGHEIWMAGASEVVYCTIMMQNKFIAPSINIETIDSCATGLQIAQKTIHIPLNIILSNSFGFGGTNCSIVLKKTT